MTNLNQNCVFEQELPCQVNSLDYSSELNLYAALDCGRSLVNIWNPQSKKIVAEFDVLWDGVSDVLFLPGNYIAASGGEANHGSDISIFSLNEKDPVLVINDILGIDDPFQLCLTPDKNLLVSGFPYQSLSKIHIDYENMTILDQKNIILPQSDDSADDALTGTLCCSSNYTICYNAMDESTFSTIDLEFSENGEVKFTNEQVLTYCVVKGEERYFGEVLGLQHDGDKVIVATDKDIIVLESAIEGCPGQVIVSSGIGASKHDYGQIRLNDKNHLMVCDGGRFIKVYDYKGLNSLQGLCRYRINNSLGKKNQRSIDKLPIPKTLKDYLLYEY